MKRNSSRVLPVWLIATLVGVVMVSPVAAYLLLRRSPPPPSPPPAVVVSACRDMAPGMRRVGFNIEFDVPEAGFALHSCSYDSPPSVVYNVMVSNRGTDINPILQMSVWHLDFERELTSTWPVYSDHVEERNVRNGHGRLVGKDLWGCFKSGERWRFVKFDWGEEAGYLPTPDKEAQAFDQIINSACFTAASRP